jgi:hypothetical protein
MAGTPPPVQKIYFTPRWWRPRKCTDEALCPPQTKFLNTTTKSSFTPLLASARLHGLRRCALHTAFFSKTTMAQSTSRHIRCLARGELQRRITKHLHDVERTHQGPRQSIRLYIKACNADFPQNRPICSTILFGEEGYFFDEGKCTDPPPAGWRIHVHY